MLALLVRLVALVLWVAVLPLLALRRLAGRAPPGAWLLVEIDGAVTDVPPPGRRWVRRMAQTLSLHALSDLVDEAARDPRVGGLLLVIKSMRGGFATAASLGQVLSRLRAAGKRLTVHLPHGGGTREAYVAARADEIVLGPQAILAPVGVLAASRYVRGALDRAGLVPEVLARGRFKTAAEPFERSAMSAAQREQLEAVLDAIHKELVRAIAEGRHMDAERAGAVVDGAPYFGAEAVEAGLVDRVAYDDEVAPPRASGPGRTAVRPAHAYLRARRALRVPRLGAPAVIGVVHVHGPIASAPMLPMQVIAIEDRVIGAVRVAMANPRVRGVVLHVNSPGGGALASDRIHRELARLAAGKPLVACMADVAASGGYYVAAAAHEIIAQPTTITGSIGVVSARLVIDPLLQRLGVVTEVLQRGAHARLLDPALSLGESDRAALEREVEHIYRAFLQAVAKGRGRRVEEIEPLAEGRVWTGEEARARGLVDRLGGFEVALDAVRVRLGAGAEKLRVVAVRPPRKPPRWPETPEKRAARLLAELVAPVAQSLGVEPGLLALAGGDRVLAWSDAAAGIRT